MARSIKEKQVIFYQDSQGEEPCFDWINRIRDSQTRRRILQRIYRIQSGNYGDTIVVLLCGGDKSTQAKDIKLAKTYWKEYLK